MFSYRVVACLVVFLLAGPGCSAIFTGTSQQVQIVSNPPFVITPRTAGEAPADQFTYREDPTRAIERSLINFANLALKAVRVDMLTKLYVVG